MAETKRSHWTAGSSRRGFLAGAGLSLALPWFSSLPARADSGKRAAANGDLPPRRFGCIYFSNGVEPAHWWVRGLGNDFRLNAETEFGPCLQPLAPHRDQIVVIDGLFNEQAVKNPARTSAGCQICFRARG